MDSRPDGSSKSLGHAERNRIEGIAKLLENGWKCVEVSSFGRNVPNPD